MKTTTFTATVVSGPLPGVSASPPAAPEPLDPSSRPGPSGADPSAFPRQPGETPRAFAAFLAYFRLGQTRSLPAVADLLGEKPDTVKRWSCKYEWSHRLHTFYAGLLQSQAESEAALQNQNADDWARRTREFREHEWDAGQKLLSAVICFLESFGDREVEKMTLGQVSRALQISNRGVEWAAAFDYGFNHYTVALLGAYDSDGNLFIVDEHAARLWVPERNAEAIKAMLQRHKVRLKPVGHYSVALSRFVAGADLFARQANGLSIARQYADLGIDLRPANMDRINGWAAIHKSLGDPAVDVAPRLFIHRRCSRLVETLPILQHDPNRPEDVLKINPDDDGIGGDDAADALRYLVAYRPARVVAKNLRGL